MPPSFTCNYAILGTGKCEPASSTTSMFPSYSFPYETCAENCDEDEECLAYSQSVSYSCSGNDCDVYNNCLYYTETVTNADGIEYGIGSVPPQCMSKDVDTCVAPTASPTVPPTIFPNVGDDELSTSDIILFIVVPVVAGLVFLVFLTLCGCRLRNRFVVPPATTEFPSFEQRTD